MKKTKQVLGWIAATAILVMISVLQISSDYTWAKTIINEKEKEGWTIVAQDNNYSSLGSPWTLFKTPVSTVSFAGEILKFNEQFFYSKKLVTFYQSFDHTVEDYFHNIYDCYNQKITTVDPDIDSNNFTWDDWEWREIKSNSIDNDFYQYICAKNNGEKN